MRWHLRRETALVQLATKTTVLIMEPLMKQKAPFEKEIEIDGQMVSILARTLRINFACALFFTNLFFHLI